MFSQMPHVSHYSGIILGSLIAIAPLSAISQPVIAQSQDRPVNPLAEASLNQGITLYQQNNFKGAIAAFNQALTLQPGYPLAYNNRGLAKVALKSFSEAIQDFNQAIQLNPDYLFAFNNRGKAHRLAGNYEAAIQDYSKALTLNSDHIEAYAGRGLTYARQGNFEAALQDYARVVQAQPSAKAHYNQGTALAQLGRWNEAIASFNQALAIQPRNSVALVNRGNAFALAGNRDRALQDLNTAVSISPNTAIAHQSLGNIFYDQQKYSEALQSYARSLQIEPKQAKSWFNSGLAHLKLGNQEQAIAHLKKAQQLFEAQGQENAASEAASLLGQMQ